MPIESPPPRLASTIEAHRPTGPGCVPCLRLQQAQQPPVQIPQVDIAVEVVGNLPLQAKLEDVSRLLGKRQQAGSIYRVYPPTILELITLVKRNPAKPRGRAWNSIRALNMRYNAQTLQVTVEYCIDHCGHDPQTGAFDPKRKMVSYSAPEQQVVTKANKKLADLKKYDDRPPSRDH